MMKFAFNEISVIESSHRIVDDGWFPHAEITADKPVGGDFTIRRIGDLKAEVRGVLSVTAKAACDRCGRMVAFELAGDEFTYECIIGKEEVCCHEETECREEDYNRIYLEESVVDVGDILREQVLLAIPVRVLCSQSCKGLCPECGKDLNSGMCTCDSENISSPFAALQQVKGR